MRLWHLFVLTWVSLAFGVGNEPIFTPPIQSTNQPTASFTSDLRTYLLNEDAGRQAELFARIGMVYSGGSHGTIAGMTSPAFATTAYTNIFHRVVQSSVTINYATVGCANDDRGWVIISARAENNLDNFQRVTGTDYFVDCVNTARPLLPLNASWLMRVTFTAGAITHVMAMFATNSHNPGRIYGSDPYINMACDGHTDDSAALQRAVDLSSNRGGVGIELPAGTCLVKDILIENNPTPGGIDDADARMGCTSLFGQGAGKSVLSPPDSITAEQYVLKVSCTPLGAGHFADPYPGNYPGGVTLRDFSIYGRQNRELESHGLLVEGGHVRVESINIQSINGHALHIGKDEKLESGWFSFVHIRHSGRYTEDGGRGDGEPGSNNRAAVFMGEPSNGQNSNNISFYGLQLGFNWYTAFEMDCEPESFIANVFFYAGMYHNNEEVGAGFPKKQGRLSTDTGLFWIHGNCFNISFHGANANAPGSDAFDTNDPDGDPVAIFHLDDVVGAPSSAARTGPDSVFFSDIYGNQSCCGQLFRFTAARAVSMSGIRAGTNNTLDYPDGQLFITPAPDIDTSGGAPPEGNDQLQLKICQSTFDPLLTFVHYKDVEKIHDCNREVYSQLLPSDANRRVPARSVSTFSIGSATDPPAVTKAHMLTCQPSPEHIHVMLTDEPDRCAELYVTNIGAANYTLTCGIIERAATDPATHTTIGGDGITGSVIVEIPEGCTTAAAMVTPPPPATSTPLFSSMHRRVYIHGITWKSRNPGTAENASHCATVKLYKRRILSEVHFATASTCTDDFPSYTEVPFTIIDMNELIWDPEDSISYAITKTGNGVALEEALISIATGTNILANRN